MRKIVLLVLGSLLVIMLAATDLQAGLRRKLKHADRNKDGKVARREWKKEKRWERRQKAEVDKPWEEKADKNEDGRVGPAEKAAAKRHRYLRKRSDADRPWEKKADTNKDGQVDGKELRKYHLDKLDKNEDGKIDGKERRSYWAGRKAVVNTELEKKYDADGNGRLSWEEKKEMLKDKLRVINTRSRAMVNTDIELEFDVNGDGIIDKEEAKALREALKEEKSEEEE